MIQRDQEAPGVYLLFLNRQLVYVGKSKTPNKRVETHRMNGRPFDYVLVVPCPPGDENWVEAALIKAFEPAQNRQGLIGRNGSRVAPPEPPPPPRIIYAPAPEPEPPRPLTTERAEREVQPYGLRPALKQAIADRSVPWTWANPAHTGPSGRRIIMSDDLEEWMARVHAEREAATRAAIEAHLHASRTG